MKKRLLFIAVLCALALPVAALDKNPRPFYLKVGSLCAVNPQRALAAGEKEYVTRGNVFGSTSQKCPGRAEEWTPDDWALPPGTHVVARSRPDGTKDPNSIWIRQCGQPFKPNHELNHGDPVLDIWIDPNSLAGLPDRVTAVEGDVGQLKADVGDLKSDTADLRTRQGSLTTALRDESWRNRSASRDNDRDRKLATSVMPQPGFCSRERHRTGCIVAAFLLGGGSAYALTHHGGESGGSRVYRPGQP